MERFSSKSGPASRTRMGPPATRRAWHWDDSELCTLDYAAEGVSDSDHGALFFTAGAASGGPCPWTSLEAGWAARTPALPSLTFFALTP